MSAPTGFNPNASMLPDPGPSAAPIQVMKGGGGTMSRGEGSHQLVPDLTKGPADPAGSGGDGVFTPEELTELAKYQLAPGGVIANDPDMDVPTKRAFLEQLKDTTRCRRTTGNSIVLGKECWAVVKVIRALLRAKVQKANAATEDDDFSNTESNGTVGEEERDGDESPGGTGPDGGLTRGTGSRSLVGPGATGPAEPATGTGGTPATENAGAPAATGTGGTPGNADAPAATGTGGIPGNAGAPAATGTGGTPGNAGAPATGTGGTGPAGNAGAPGVPAGQVGPTVGVPPQVTGNTPPSPDLEALLQAAEDHYGNRPAPCQYIPGEALLTDLLEEAEAYYEHRPSPCQYIPQGAAEDGGNLSPAASFNERPTISIPNNTNDAEEAVRAAAEAATAAAATAKTPSGEASPETSAAVNAALGGPRTLLAGVKTKLGVGAAGPFPEDEQNNSSVNEATRDTPMSLDELDDWITTYAESHDIEIGDKEVTTIAEPDDPNYKAQLSDNPEMSAIMKEYWKVIQTQGGGHCLLHAILTSVSPTYRHISYEDRAKVGAAYRKEEFYKLFTPEIFETFGPEFTEKDKADLLKTRNNFPKVLSGKTKEQYERTQDFVKNTDEFLTEFHAQVFINVFKLNIFSIRRQLITAATKNDPAVYQFTMAILHPDDNVLNTNREEYDWIFMFNTLDGHFSSIKTHRLTYIMTNYEFKNEYGKALGPYLRSQELYAEFIPIRDQLYKEFLRLKPDSLKKSDPYDHIEAEIYNKELKVADIESIPDVIQHIGEQYKISKEKIKELQDKYKDLFDSLVPMAKEMEKLSAQQNFTGRRRNSGSNAENENSGSEGSSGSNNIGFESNGNSGSMGSSGSSSVKFESSNENSAGSSSSRKSRRSAYTFIKRTRRRRNTNQSRKRR